MSRMHLKFKNFRETTLEAAEVLFDSKPWAMESDTEREIVANVFAASVSEAYQATTLQIAVHRRGPSQRMSYRPALVEEDAIGQSRQLRGSVVVISPWSLFHLFRGVRTHLLACGEEPVSEADPEQWAASLFYAVRPEMFRARVREGRIPGMVARDTYSVDTWGRMLGEGMGDDHGRLRYTRQQTAQWAAGTVTAEDLAAEVAAAQEAAQAVSEETAAVASIEDDADETYEVEDEWDDDMDEESEGPDDEDDPDTDEEVSETAQAIADSDSDSESATTFSVGESESFDDGLDGLSLVKMRQLGKGKGIERMWDLDADTLRAKLRAKGITNA